jgi:hypothetical protein
MLALSVCLSVCLLSVCSLSLSLSLSLSVCVCVRVCVCAARAGEAVKGVQRVSCLLCAVPVTERRRQVEAQRQLEAQASAAATAMQERLASAEARRQHEVATVERVRAAEDAAKEEALRRNAAELTARDAAVALARAMKEHQQQVPPPSARSGVGSVLRHH